MASKKQQSAKGKKQPKKASTKTLIKAKKPIAQSAPSFRMYRHILIPTDGSELAHKAAVHGLSLAKALGARTTVLTVEPSFMTPTFTEHTKSQTTSALNAIADEAKICRRAMRGRANDTGGPSRSDNCCGNGQRLRPHRNEFPRTARVSKNDSW
jgi:hypothetical protein